MQAALGPCQSGQNAKPKTLEASFQQSMSAASHPINPLTAAQLQLLLLGCSQASSLCDARFIKFSVNVVDDEDDDDDDDDDGDFSATPTLVEQYHSPPTIHTRDVKNPAHYSPPLWYSSAVPRYPEIGSRINPAYPSTHYHTAVRGLSAPFYSSPTLKYPTPATRSLTTTFDDLHMVMTTTASAPGSPPDLSASRSSKSSSYCSTVDSGGPDGLSSDVINFEEIGLDDDRDGAHPESSKLRLQKSRTVDSTLKTAVPSQRRPHLPDLQSQVREAIRQKENEGRVRIGASKGHMRRGFTSPVNNFTPPSHPPQRPRSSSPPKRTPSSMSTTALSADSLLPGWISKSSLPLLPRRGSWQPKQRSVQELEAECHDSDDELPEDASLWNVPVSPHPGNQSRRSSFRGSPARGPMTLSPRPIPLSHAQTAPDSPPPSGSLSQKLPRQRPPPARSSSLTTSLSSPSSPRRQNFRRHGRTNSWNLAMSDLSEEARILSENLAFHAETQRQVQIEGSQSLGSMDLAILKASKIQLPPVQKGNLDFMPISKEKEAILSRTRPSWLPPKDPKEERRHLKEYQRMMAASLEADKKRNEKVSSEQFQQEDVLRSLNRIWHYYSEETTDLGQIDKRVYDLCWQGISSKPRGRVWQRAVGNQLGLTAKSFEKALERAKEMQSKPRDALSDQERAMNRWFVDIERDAETAFPELNVFQRGGPLWQDLIELCKAYACYRGDVGYVYGLQLVAALILLQVPGTADAFVLLANCMNRAAPLAFQSGDFSTMARTYNHTVETLAIKFPRLHEYLFGSIEDGGLGFTAELIFEPMFRTVFSNGLDIDKLCRVWDIWVFEGDKTLVRTAVAILGCVQTQLYEVEGDIDLKRRNIQEMLAWGPFNRTSPGQYWRLPNINEDKFVEEIRLAGTLDYRGR